MNKEWEAIKKLALDATKILLISILFEFLIKFQHRMFSKAYLINAVVIIRLLSFVMYAVCIYKYLVYKNIIK